MSADTPPTDTRQRLLEVGTELVAKQGFHATGISEVLQQAGVPKGSFYHHFASKEQFGIALIEHAVDEYVAELKPIVSNRKLSPRARLRQMFVAGRDCAAESGPNDECVIYKIGLEAARLSEPVHAAVRSAYQQWCALLAQVIREAQAAGEIDRKFDADQLGRMLVMLWEGAGMRMQIERSVAPLDETISFVFDTLLGPIGRT